MPGTATLSVDADRSGLSSAVAADRLLRDGPNELPRADRHSVLRLALDVLSEYARPDAVGGETDG